MFVDKRFVFSLSSARLGTKSTYYIEPRGTPVFPANNGFYN